MPAPNMTTKKMLDRAPHTNSRNLMRVIRSTAMRPARLDQPHVCMKPYTTANADITPIAMARLLLKLVKSIVYSTLNDT